MVSVFELRDKTNYFIELLTINKVDRFYPTALAKYLDITPTEAFNLLAEKSGEHKELILNWELRCPYCSRTLAITTNKDINDEYNCNCGEEFDVRVSDFYPVFKINPEFKDYVNSTF